MLQQQAVVRGNSTAVPTNEGDGERKEVVREHQWHTSSTTEVLVRMGRHYVMLATCAQRRRRHGRISSSLALPPADLGQTLVPGIQDESQVDLN